MVALILLLSFGLNIKAPKNYHKFWVYSKNAPKDFSYAIETLGGRERAVSQWLKIQSFEIDRRILKLLETKKDIKFQPVLSGTIQDCIPCKISKSKEFRYGLSYDQLSLIGIPGVHKEGYFGSGVVIGVLDTGFDSTHPAINYLFKYKRIKASHDFNSGDHLKCSLGNIPAPYNGTAIYINSLDALKVSDTLHYVFYSVAQRDLMTGYNVKRWELWANRIVHENSGYYISNPFKVLGPTAISPQVVKGDSGKIFLVYQKLEGLNYDVYFSILQDTTIIHTVNISNDVSESISPLIFKKDSILWVFWVNPEKGLYFRKSYNLGQRFLGEKLIFPFKINPLEIDGIDGTIKNDTLLIALAFRDSVFTIYSLDGDNFEHQYLSHGRFPSVFKNSGLWLIEIVNNGLELFEGKIGEGFSKIRLIEDTTLFIRFPLIVYDTISNEFYQYLSLGGYLLRFGLGPDIENPVLTPPDTIGDYFSDFSIYRNGLLFWRQRGDKDVTPDDMLPGRTGGPNYHGTKVLSVIAGFDQSQEMVGPAIGSEFVLCKTEINKTAQGIWENIIEEDFWVEGLEFAATHGARVINSSLGYRVWYPQNSMMNGQIAISSREASMAAEKGVLVVTAMGNCSRPFPDPIKGDTSLVAPADAKNIIAVGSYAIDSSTGELLPKSCYGPSSDGRIKPEVVAPFYVRCGAMETPQGDTLPAYYFICGGTSFGTALVSGAAACLLEAHPSWSPFKLREAILKTATPITDIPGFFSVPDSNNITGWGLINAYKALHYEPPEVPEENAQDHLLLPYPNPVDFSKGQKLHIPFELFHTTFVEIHILDMLGKEIKSFYPGILQVGRYFEKQGFYPDIVWDGKDKNSKPVSPGLYIIVLKTGFNSSIKKVAVLR